MSEMQLELFCNCSKMNKKIKSLLRLLKTKVGVEVDVDVEYEVGNNSKTERWADLKRC